MPAETPIALSYNRLTHAVMMGTPSDLEDYAIGFSLSEGVVGNVGEIEELDVVVAERGIELRMWITGERRTALDRRRRSIAGPTGCGLCGLESLEQALRPVPTSPLGFRFSAVDVPAAIAAMTAAQTLNQRTHAVHAAGFWTAGAGLIALREDVGRHNALDKLGGFLARHAISGAGGMVVMTSRISVELVQKAAMIGVSVLAAVSAPTRLAVQVADSAGLTLIGVARGEEFEIFTHAARLVAA